jgi:hypothetical protein
MSSSHKLPAISAARDVIEACANGLPLKASLREAGLTAADFNNVLSSDRELSVAYARATEIRADLLADEVITIADCEATDPQRARNQIQARQWLAGKLHAKRYGDRIDLNVTQTIDIGSTLAEARSRILRPVSDQQETIDAEYQVIEPKITLKPSDN